MATRTLDEAMASILAEEFLMEAITTNKHETNELYPYKNIWEYHFFRILSDSSFSNLHRGKYSKDIIINLLFYTQKKNIASYIGRNRRNYEIILDDVTKAKFNKYYREEFSKTDYIKFINSFYSYGHSSLRNSEFSQLQQFTQEFISKDYIQEFSDILNSLNSFICRDFNIHQQIKKFFTTPHELKSIATKLEKLESNLANDYNLFCNMSDSLFAQHTKYTFFLVEHRHRLDELYKLDKLGKETSESAYEYLEKSPKTLLKRFKETDPLIESFQNDLKDSCLILSFLFYEYKLYISELKEMCSKLLEQFIITAQFKEDMKRNFMYKLEFSLNTLSAAELEKTLNNKVA